MTATPATSTGHQTTDMRPVEGALHSVHAAHTASGARCRQRRHGSGAPVGQIPAPPDPESGGDRVRTVQRDGTVVWTTPILEYQPVLTSQDYAVLARLRDQAHADIARRATNLPNAA